MQLGSSVSEVHNIGKQRLLYLNNMGIFTVEDLIEHFPREYDDRSDIKTISDLVPNEVNTFIGSLNGNADTIRIKNMVLTRAKITDDTATVNAVWYNQPYLKNTFKDGQRYIFTGKYQHSYGKKEVVSPEYEALDKGELLSGGRIIPVYNTTKGISQKIFRSIIKDTLEKSKNQLVDFIPKCIRMENKLCDRNFAVQNIHFPEDDNSFFTARRRLVFEELFVLQTALLKMKTAVKEGKSGIIIKNEKAEKEISMSIGFELTKAQKKVKEEIKADFVSGKVMNRLVQGDVGSGKTAVAMITSFIAIKEGFQAALMAPTEVLAKQHYYSFKDVFEQFGVNVVYLSGAMKKKEKTDALRAVEDGSAEMVIGTHAVIQKGVTFKNLGFVVTDEQHRFGVNQRILLSQKGNNPHVLVMTATPIPRTLALILYGDLDISIIDELPPGRQEIDTRAVNTSYRPRIYSFIKKEIDKGRQAYVVCPSIEESEKRETEAVIEYAEKLMDYYFKDYKVAVLYGKMKNDEKQSVMEDFANGNIDVLVSTTVIEVGVNVPNATIMLIENAEMFGLSQLHQLRGRVGRGSEQSYCILVSDSKNKVTIERMKVMQKTRDGFVISETDLRLRGPGEFFGTKQHGLPMLKIANLYKDIDILKEAQTAAAKIIEQDSNLEQQDNNLLNEKTNRFFQNRDIGI
ncbi:MAG: ATP-dependent DNA helicase RecG [Lachnospiraceae bacterium]|nr:ATP-dependent DNA helicase RecG [Lachnospiraceae bacterium]